MAPPTFGNFGKAAKDLFKKGYEYKNETKFNTKAAGGSKVECGVYQGKSVTGYGKGNFKLNPIGDVEVEVHTNETIKGQVKLANLPKGSAATLTSNLAGDITAEGTYAQCNANLTTKISHNVNKGSTGVNASLSLAQGNFAFGGAINAGIDGSLKDYNVGAQFSQSDLTVALFTSKSLSTYNVSLHQKVSKDLSSGFAVALGADGSRSLNVGVDYKLDGKTNLKTKIDNKGILGVSVGHTLNDSLKGTVGAQFDACGNAVTAQKLGVSLQFNY